MQCIFDIAFHDFAVIFHEMVVKLICFYINRVFSPTHHPQFIRDKFGSEYLDKDVADQILSASGSVQRVSSFGSEPDWMEPSAYLCNSQPEGCQRVYEAFSLLQNESSVQVLISC